MRSVGWCGGEWMIDRQVRCYLIVMAVTAGVLVARPSMQSRERVFTYYTDVLPILQEKCQSCHRTANTAQSTAPMAFDSYEHTRPWASAIARKVRNGEMPPWFGAEPIGVFENERRLTSDERDAILSWVTAGAPAGDPSSGPPPRSVTGVANGDWSLGQPDLVVSMPKPFFIEDDAYDIGVTFYSRLDKADWPADGFIRGWELRAGKEGQVVHHMCVGILSPDEPVRPDSATDERGQLGCIAHCAEPQMLPEGFGRLLKPGSTVRFNMHYHKEAGPGTAVWAQSEIGFFRTNTPIRHSVTTDAIGNFGFEIPPDQDRYRVGAGRLLESDTWLLALWPHAHLRATAARYRATFPDGRQEVLLDVPHYDQDWQLTYNYRIPRFLPKNTLLDVSFWYDNTAARGARKGFAADETVVNGPRTNDEMALGFTSYSEAATGCQ